MFGLIAARDCMYANDHVEAKSIEVLAPMKPPPFDYARTDSVEQAIALLTRYGDEARVIAGGQSLMPMLAFRMAAPKLLVDIGPIAALRRITIDERGVTLGALVRWRDIERHAGLAKAQPLLAEAVKHVAHYQIRNRGTAGGSLAHADPAAELPGVAVACEAEIELAGPDGPRTVAARDFFVDSLTTALGAEELVVAVRFPAWKPDRRWAFEEFARRRGDFALAGVALFYDIEEGRAVDPHIAAIGVATTPIRLAAAERALSGRAVDAATISDVVAAAAASIDPPEDIHAPGDYRRALLGVLLERALARSAGLELAESA
jgi:carbon-monoxide dehydrogenase medium subunit